MTTLNYVSTARSALLVLLVIGGLAPFAAAQDRAINIAVVDLERVVAQSKGGKALQAKLNAFQSQVQAQGEAMAADAQKLREKIESGGAALKPVELAELQKAYEDATVKIRRFKDDKQREGQKIQSEGLRRIEVALQPVFAKIKEEQKLDLILNNVAGVVIMAGESVDITEPVLARVNAGK